MNEKMGGATVGPGWCKLQRFNRPCPTMSESSPQPTRCSPKVSPETPDGDERIMAARSLLGVDLGPHGLWGHPVRAAAYWAWVRDERNIASDELETFHAWLATFLGLAGREPDLPRHFSLGFVQGVECTLRGLQIPTPVVASVGHRGLPDLSGLPAKPSTKPLKAVQHWAASWLVGDGCPWEQVGAWQMGLVAGRRATRDDHLICGLLSAEFDSARPEQRFAARAFLHFLHHPGSDPWEAFVRSTYPDGCCEGRAISQCTRRSLDLAKSHRWRLGDYLLHAHDSGRVFGQRHRPETEKLLRGLGEEKIVALKRLFTATTGLLDQSPTPEVLLLALKNWLLETHPDLFEPRDTGAENVVLRHAYDFLWWRGLLEALTRKGVLS